MIENKVKLHPEYVQRGLNNAQDDAVFGEMLQMDLIDRSEFDFINKLISDQK